MTINPAAPHEQAARLARRRSVLRTNSAAICVMLLVQYGSAWTGHRQTRWHVLPCCLLARY